MSLQYNIKVSKDHTQVTATWDISADMSDTQLIANFTLSVEGKPLKTQCCGANKACKGADFAILANPNADCPVTFAIMTNGPEVQNGDDILRGDKTFDDVEFASD